MTATYRNPKVRKDEILAAASRLAVKHGYSHIRRDDVALEAGCSTGLVNKYYGTMTQLRRALIRNAIQAENLPIIAQAYIARAPEIGKASPELIRTALAAA